MVPKYQVRKYQSVIQIAQVREYSEDERTVVEKQELNLINIAALCKVKIANGALVVAAGAMATAALICVVCASLPAGPGAEASTGTAPNALRLKEPVNMDGQIDRIHIGQNSQNIGDDSKIGVVSAKYEAGSTAAASGTTRATAGGTSGTAAANAATTGNSNGSAANSGTGSGDSAPSNGNGNGDPAPGGNAPAGNGNGNASSGGNGSSSTGGNPVTPGNTGSSSNGGTIAAAEAENRLKSACFGGADGHCYGQD